MCKSYLLDENIQIHLFTFQNNLINFIKLNCLQIKYVCIFKEDFCNVSYSIFHMKANLTKWIHKQANETKGFHTNAKRLGIWWNRNCERYTKIFFKLHSMKYLCIHSAKSYNIRCILTIKSKKVKYCLKEKKILTNFNSFK